MPESPPSFQKNLYHFSTVTSFSKPIHNMKPIFVRQVNGKITEEEFDGSILVAFLKGLTTGLDERYLKIENLVEKVLLGLPAKFHKLELYDLLCEGLASRVIQHPDYAILAGRVEAVKLQKLNKISFSANIERLKNYRPGKNPRALALISNKFYETVMAHKDFFNKLIVHERDYNLTYFGIKTLQRSYLFKINGQTAETPQFLFLRVAIGIHGDDIEAVAETYNLMSQKYFVHASPTLFNSGTEYNYLSSCFLVAMEDDSIDGIYRTLHKTALISKAAGGVGLHVHNIRSAGAYISSTNGTSTGLVPMLRVFNNTARYVDQGGNKRPGAFAIYIEPWHADILDVLDLRKNHGKEEMRTRDLFFGLWVPDLFMQRVKDNGEWSLFSPDEAPGLADAVGEEFVKLYEQYEKEGRAFNTIKAQKLWHAILEAQTETGGPYMLYKDACNEKSNQKNLGTIKSSNLCTEIVEYSTPEETAVCNLASLALPTFIKTVRDTKTGTESLQYDFVKLHSVTKVLTRNLNKIIDVTRYPVESTHVSNMKHRPIALGVQGLADVFCELRMPFDSQEARHLNIQIFETIYHAAIETSIELAAKEGKYSSFEGSPASKGLLQFDLWNHKPSPLFDDWDVLKEKVKTTGLRNSLLVAPMPTASTSQILGFNECFEPYTSNIYNRRVLAGEYQIVNKYLLKDLIDLGLWNSSMKNKIIQDNGSIQHIPNIPQEIKDLYKTVWEISQKVIIDMSADRGKFICQSQSMNVHLQNPTFGKLTACHFYAWERGLKTGMYYLRTQAASRAIQFTVDALEANSVNGLADMSKLVRKPYQVVSLIKGNDVNVEDVEHVIAVPKAAEIHKSEEDEISKRLADDVVILEKTGANSLGDEENYNIYDSTPLVCYIKNGAAECTSCSG